MTEAQAKKRAKEIHSLFVGTFGTEIGQKCLAHLEEVFVDRPIFKIGQTIEETAHRQGEADVIKKIIKEARNGTTR